MLDLAARVALRGEGLVEPNPMVGAVVVRQGCVLGIGHHHVYGGAHAEREAIESAHRRGHTTSGATMYVTLEPCAHHGKQPPCTETILDAGLERVVCAVRDPGGVSGGGARFLERAGVGVEFVEVSERARWLSEPFIKRSGSGLPWVIAKWAQTIDGRVATRTGQSQWISNEWSRRRVHRLRARVDAILTGIGTVVADDPMLTPRGVRRVRRVARRVIVDPHLSIDPSAAVVRTAREVPTIVACAKSMATASICTDAIGRLEASGVGVLGVPELAGEPGKLDLEMLLRALVDRHAVSTVLVEAGAGLMGSLFGLDLVDEAIVYVAPLLLGDDRAMSVAHGRVVETLRHGRSMRLISNRRLNGDLEIRYRRQRACGEPEIPGQG